MDRVFFSYFCRFGDDDQTNSNTKKPMKFHFQAKNNPSNSNNQLTTHRTSIRREFCVFVVFATDFSFLGRESVVLFIVRKQSRSISSSLFNVVYPLEFNRATELFGNRYCLRLLALTLFLVFFFFIIIFFIPSFAFRIVFIIIIRH